MVGDVVCVMVYDVFIYKPEDLFRPRSLGLDYCTQGLGHGVTLNLLMIISKCIQARNMI